MAAQTDTGQRPTVVGESWYSRSPDAVAAALKVDPAAGLSAATAAERLKANGPNALPEDEANQPVRLTRGSAR